MPLAIRRSVSRSMWNRSSSSSSRSTLVCLTSDRSRTSAARNADMVPPSSRRTENEPERFREPLPLLLLGRELAAASRGERVEASAAIVVGDAPLRGYPAARLEAVQGGVERAVVDAERTARRGLDGLGEVPAVGRSGLQQLEHDQV